MGTQKCDQQSETWENVQKLGRMGLGLAFVTARATWTIGGFVRERLSESLKNKRKPQDGGRTKRTGSWFEA